MKKLIAILLAAAVVFAFAGCKENKNNASDNTQTPSSTTDETVSTETASKAEETEEAKTKSAGSELKMSKYEDLMDAALSEAGMSARSTKKETTQNRYDIYTITNEKYGDAAIQADDDGNVIGICTSYTGGSKNSFDVLLNHAMAACFTPAIPYIKAVSGSSLSVNEIARLFADEVRQNYNNYDYHQYSLMDGRSKGMYFKAKILGVDCAFIINTAGAYASLACGNFFSSYDSLYGQ